MQCFRYQELEDALGLAEQHLKQHDKQTVVEDLQGQIKHLQADLRSKSAAGEDLWQGLQKAQAAKQQANDELAASLKLQVCSTCLFYTSYCYVVFTTRPTCAYEFNVPSPIHPYFT